MDPSIYFVAFSGGLLTFLNPCNLVNLFTFLSFIGSEGTSSRRGFFLSIVYGLGFSLIYAAIGLAMVFIDGFILKQTWLQVVGGIVIIIIGVLMATGIFRRGGNEPEDDSEIPINEPSEEDYDLESSLPTYTKSFVLGISLSTAGLGCVLPVLASVLTAIASSSDQLGGFLALFLYAFGMILPFIFIGLALGAINEYIILKLVKITAKLQIVFGAILILLGSYLVFNALVILGIISI